MTRRPLIALLTDFGVCGPYVGEMLAVLSQEAPQCRAVSMMCDLPRFRPRESAYLIAPLIERQPPGTVLVAVVDPGVGTPSRVPVWLEADGRLVVGPDNGLLDVVARRASRARMHEILWRPPSLSASFHGRDLFAPVAARLAAGSAPRSRARRRRFAWSRRWPEDLDHVIYVDGFGNCVTGRRAGTLEQGRDLVLEGVRIPHARTFGCLPRGELLWYENSLGLAEIAANQASARDLLGIDVGARLRLNP